MQHFTITFCQFSISVLDRGENCAYLK